MNFRSYSDLAAAVALWQESLPRDFTLVCGIPRSGLLVANLLALSWNLPVTDVAGLCAGRVLGGGRRLGLAEESLGAMLRAPQRILVVEDSVAGGAGIRQARSELAKLGGGHQIRYGAVYAAPEGRDQIDFAAEVVPMPRVFEWNLFHHPLLNHACVDIDGVLCRDPSDQENDDGRRYRAFLDEAPLRHKPSVELGWLVTSRLEKYRAQTEQWLAKHRIQYRELLMLDLPDMETRRRTGAGAAFKAEQYARTEARLFLESDTRQAMLIAETSQRPVLATDTMQLIEPGVSPARLRQRRLPAALPLLSSRWPRRAARLWRRWCDHACRLLPHL